MHAGTLHFTSPLNEEQGSDSPWPFPYTRTADWCRSRRQDEADRQPISSGGQDSYAGTAVQRQFVRWFACPLLVKKHDFGLNFTVLASNLLTDSFSRSNFINSHGWSQPLSSLTSVNQKNPLRTFTLGEGKRAVDGTCAVPVPAMAGKMQNGDDEQIVVLAYVSRARSKKNSR